MNRLNDARSVGDRLIEGGLWMGLWRWSARLMGFVTTIVLARFLVPADFGVVATAMLVVYFFDILIDLGTDSYLIRLEDPDRLDYDTAWTLRMIVIAGAALTIVVSAWPVAEFFDDHRLVAVLPVLAVASFLRAFTNIGMTMYRRELRFSRVAMVGLGQRIVGSIVTIVLAFILENYWAMVFGEFAFRVTEVVLSYAAHPYRPRPAFARFGSQWDFCKWIVARNVARFLQGRGDQLVVAKLYGIEQIGLYGMAMRFAAMPTTHLMAPVLPPIYSALAKKQSVPDEFRASALQVIGASAALMLPAATLFAVLGEPLVFAILGSHWLVAAPLIAPLVFTIAIGVLIEPANVVLTLTGRVRLLAVLNWLSAIGTVAVMVLLSLVCSLEQLAIARVFLALAVLLSYYAWMRPDLGVSWGELYRCVVRPVAACLVMAGMVGLIVALPVTAWLKIAFSVLVGGAGYLAALYVFWRLASSPNSGEAVLTRKLGALLGHLSARLRGRGDVRD